MPYQRRNTLPEFVCRLVPYVFRHEEFERRLFKKSLPSYPKQLRHTDMCIYDQPHLEYGLVEIKHLAQFLFRQSALFKYTCHGRL